MLFSKKTLDREHVETNMFIITLFIFSKIRNNLDTHLQENEQIIVSSHSGISAKCENALQLCGSIWMNLKNIWVKGEKTKAYINMVNKWRNKRNLINMTSMGVVRSAHGRGTSW